MVQPTASSAAKIGLGTTLIVLLLILIYVLSYLQYLISKLLGASLYYSRVGGQRINSGVIKKFWA